jgi:hypothetical protein
MEMQTLLLREMHDERLWIHFHDRNRGKGAAIRTAAEKAVAGKPLDDATIAAATERALAGARPLRENAFKVELAQRAIVRALMTLTNGDAR